MTTRYLEPELNELVARINGKLTRWIALRWKREEYERYGADFVCIVGFESDKALSVYMNPDTMRKRLELVARMIDA